jgi:hypothetical protein
VTQRDAFVRVDGQTRSSMMIENVDRAAEKKGVTPGGAGARANGALASVELQACQYCVLLVRGIQQRRVFLCGEDSSDARTRLRHVIEQIPGLADTTSDWFEFFGEATRLFAAAGFVRVAH